MSSWTTTMADALERLVLEQTSPQEMILFIATCVGICVLISLLAYGALVTLLWMLRYRTKVRLRALLLPAGVRESGIEVALSAVTTAALLFTFSAKEELLGALKRHDLDACVAELDSCKAIRDREAVRSSEAGPAAASGEPSRPQECDCDIAALFPNERVPGALGQAMTARAGAAGASLTASELLGPVIAAGSSLEAKRFLIALLPEARASLGSKSSAFFTDQGHSRDLGWLIVVCGLLVSLHVVWLTVRRFAELKRVDVSFYGGTLRKLVLLGTCIALLLIAPSVVQDDELVAEAAVASVRAGAPPDTALASEVKRIIRRQRGARSYIATLVPRRDGETLWDALSAVGADLSRLDSRLEAGLTDLGARISEQGERLTLVPEERQSDIAELDATMRKWHAQDLDEIRRSVAALGRADDQLEAEDRSNRDELERMIASGDEVVRDELGRRMDRLGAGFVTVPVHRGDLQTLREQLAADETQLRQEIEARGARAEQAARSYHDSDRRAAVGALVVSTSQRSVTFSLNGRSESTSALRPWVGLLTPGTYTVQKQEVTVVANQVKYHPLGFIVQ